MRVTIEELQNKLDYYLEKAIEEDVEIIENHTIIALLTNPVEFEKIKRRFSNEVFYFFTGRNDQI